MARRELKYQAHIIESYKKCDGYGARWDNKHVVGPPDLILSVPWFGVHLAEVKHLPTWIRTIQNPMTDKQQEYARKYLEAGGDVFLYIVRGGGTNVLDAEIALFPPLQESYHPDQGHWVKYTPGKGWDIRELLAGRRRNG